MTDGPIPIDFQQLDLYEDALYGYEGLSLSIPYAGLSQRDWARYAKRLKKRPVAFHPLCGSSSFGVVR